MLPKKNNCCGCSACVDICPVGAIYMKSDEEGFMYPEIDKEKCINCNMCEKVCPCINDKIEDKSQIIKIYARIY